PERAAAATWERLVQAGGSGHQLAAVRTVRYGLGAGLHAAQPSDGLKTLPVETEDLRAGVGPEGAIRGHVQGVDFAAAGQPFGSSHQAKAGSVIPVQAAFRPSPDVAGAVLRQRQDDQVLKPFGSPIVAEAVLLREPAAAQ